MSSLLIPGYRGSLGIISAFLVRVQISCDNQHHSLNDFGDLERLLQGAGLALGRYGVRGCRFRWFGVGSTVHTTVIALTYCVIAVDYSLVFNP